MSNRVVLYARISVSADESVSVSRQLDSGRKYAEARGWTVVAEHVDDGVSASKNRPEDRAGWRAILDSPERFDAVVVWKVDRLARRVLDFLHAHEALQARGAGLVAVEDPVDMTTAQGRAFATILAVFGEMEAEAISARVKAARRALVSEGRVVGGRLPYGWTSEKRGAGRYLVKDPERIGYVTTAARMILDGRTVKAVCTWLDAEGAPLPPSANRQSGGWHFSTVSNLLRNPVLVGMTLDNPGNDTKVRGHMVKRNADGLPVINPEVAILKPDEHRRLIALLDSREKPRTSQTATSPFFSRLIECGHCDRFMHRTRKNNRESLVCPSCDQVISTRQLRDLLEERLLAERGTRFLAERVLPSDDNPDLAEIEVALADLSAQLTRDDADVPSLLDQIQGLKELRSQARSTTSTTGWRRATGTVKAAWERAECDVSRREVLASQVEAISVRRGKGGRFLDRSRVAVAWADR